MLKKKGLVLTMAATLVLGSVMTVSAADVSTPEEPVSEERLINYPASAQLTDIFGNVYSVNGYCTELVNGSGATTNFRVASYVSGSTAAQRAELDRLAKRVQVGGGVFYSDFSTANFSNKIQDLECQQWRYYYKRNILEERAGDCRRPQSGIILLRRLVG